MFLTTSWKGKKNWFSLSHSLPPLPPLSLPLVLNDVQPLLEKDDDSSVFFAFPFFFFFFLLFFWLLTYASLQMDTEYRQIQSSHLGNVFEHGHSHLWLQKILKFHHSNCLQTDGEKRRKTKKEKIDKSPDTGQWNCSFFFAKISLTNICSSISEADNRILLWLPMVQLRLYF